MFIAVCLVLWSGATGSAELAWETGVIGALSFLWIWYWGWGIVRLLFAGLAALGITVGGGAAGGKAAGVLGALGGAAVGAAGGAFLIAKMVVGSVLLIGGVHLLELAAMPGVAFADWNGTYLAAGGIVLLIGLIMSQPSSSSSSNND